MLNSEDSVNILLLLIQQGVFSGVAGGIKIKLGTFPESITYNRSQKMKTHLISKKKISLDTAS